MDNFLAASQEAALRAGDFLKTSFGHTAEINYKDTGRRDPCSSADKGAEEIILSFLKERFPGHRFVSEEREPDGLGSDYTWFVDPLDGTVNFLHGYRNFAISIALAHSGEIIAGVVYNPISAEMFHASLGKGAYLNGKKLAVSSTPCLEESLLAISFPYASKHELFNRTLDYFARLSRASQAIRRDGSTALSLCNVACGRCDGFLVAGNEPWDYAAGTLMVAEAGGKVTDFRGRAFKLNENGHQIVASNGLVHQSLVQNISES